MTFMSQITLMSESDTQPRPPTQLPALSSTNLRSLPISFSRLLRPQARTPTPTNFAKVLTCASPTSGRTPTPNPVLVRPPELISRQHGPNVTDLPSGSMDAPAPAPM
ncbi:hypothetical protein ONZ51_g371 [Trametes cubensis]|uniref:Uncharacterized protein n=1 Tax=Trametes cubensis TaxID=1111947 RepID=A0AAD7U4W4_9APHY|nr:hypothetical protein ONZ51_g371 [Trametes cubensis]